MLFHLMYCKTFMTYPHLYPIFLQGFTGASVRSVTHHAGWLCTCWMISSRSKLLYTSELHVHTLDVQSTPSGAAPQKLRFLEGWFLCSTVPFHLSHNSYALLSLRPAYGVLHIRRQNALSSCLISLCGFELEQVILNRNITAWIQYYQLKVSLNI